MCEVDVIVPTLGKRHTQLKECLNGLAKQTVPVNVILVLPSKKSTTWNMTRFKQMFGENLTVLFEPRKNLRGSHRAVACNYGLRFASGKYVGFLDDDVSVPVDWVESSLKYFAENVAGVSSGAKVGCSAFHLVQSFGSDGHAKEFDAVTEVSSVPGYNSIYLRSAVLAVGGFNEGIGGCEDWELNYRLRGAGWKLLGVPAASVDHRHGYSFGSFSRQMVDYGWSRARLLRVCSIFTVEHSLPLAGVLGLLVLSIVSLGALLVVLGLYFAGLVLLVFAVKPCGFRGFCRVFAAFVVMHVSWAWGYFVGLVF